MSMLPDTLKALSIKVSQYFLDFLESDFKRQKAPRRRVVLQTESGFKAGMSLLSYPSLQLDVWRQLEKTWETAVLDLSPRRHTKSLSQPLRLILREQIDAITKSTLDDVISDVVNQAQNSIAKSVSHPEEWISLVREELLDSIGKNVVRPMLAFVDTALKNNAYSSVDSIFAAETDLTSSLGVQLDSALPEILSRLTVTKNIEELRTSARTLLAIDYVKDCLKQFFESFAASDAFQEFRDLETYVTTAEGLELYLYIGTAKYGTAAYPLFYLPLEVLRDSKSGHYSIRLKNQLYANKRAIDFILQELSERQQRQWLSPVAERITYLSGDAGISSSLITPFTKISQAFGFLDSLPVGGSRVTHLEDTNVVLSNALYICAFEKADEALLNDYEEMIAQIRTNKEGVVNLFQSIVDGVITSNPSSIAPEIEAEWQKMPIEQRVVPDTPIPLNEEQQKVIQAVRHHTGRFVVVEGPPGTGKSHTIVAIAADCAFRKKSCLILSDKREALEVVHSKLSAAMNEVRGSDEFPNPLLLLGAEQANFRRLTSSHALTQIEAHVKAANANRSTLEQDRDSRRDRLRQNIKEVLSTVGSIRTSEIAELERLSNQIGDSAGLEALTAFEAAYDRCKSTPYSVSAGRLSEIEGLIATLYAEDANLNIRGLERILKTHLLGEDTHLQFGRSAFDDCTTLKASQLSALGTIIAKAYELKMPILGWLFRKTELRRLASDAQSNGTFNKQLEFPRDLELVGRVINQGRLLQAVIEKNGDRDISFERLYQIIGKVSFPISGLKDITTLVRQLSAFNQDGNLDKYFSVGAPADRARLWTRVAMYLSLLHEIGGKFDSAPQLNYVSRKTDVEKLNTALMNAEVDSRLVSFMEASRADARVLAKLIKDRKKFPEEKFDSVRNAFPVMIASIREFGEYMPLKNELIDVLVIDEASQVSIAQAFPALLRARKIVVMGDSKQFSNTKSSNASIALNQKYRGELEAFFRREVSAQADMLERLSYFDVKRSVLEFCSLCANYSIMLRKHFRSYKELINYSSTSFYGGQLQAIKLRTMPLSDCIEFTELDDADGEYPRNTNPAEAAFIVERCLEFLDAECPPTVGIITPFREQQSFVSGLLSNHTKYGELREKLKIKVMTFDSCQGEERKIIFYSMVATRSKDLLNYIFPVSVEDAEERVVEKLKIQRLNVGFSRAQDMVWFVLSKPLTEFKGSIGQAMRHFNKMLSIRTADASETDPLSPMEAKVLEWIYATSFYQNRADSVEVIPQFPLGDYLKQLDPSYKHPSWRVDFLILVEIASGVVHIVVEYDGFEYHFKKGVDIDFGNHERFLNEGDIERQLTLESYGYRFLRVNRFNLGRDPISTLSERLERLLEREQSSKTIGTVRAIAEQANSLIEGTSKKCARCGEIKAVEKFFDKTLSSGKGAFGRVCTECKSLQTSSTSKTSFGGRRRKWRRWK